METPARGDALLAGLKAGGHAVYAPQRFGRDPVAAIHSPAYLLFLEEAYQRWQELSDAGPEVVANVHPVQPAASYPAGIVGRAGWHLQDAACPLGEHTFSAALLAADVALSAAQAVADGERAAYALCRPPGHHAYAETAGGFCFLNNTAIAAEYLRGRCGYRRVAVLDLDLHHGNGTQGIFYRRGDVVTLSIHADPATFYPFFWGYAGERGTGPGAGANFNFPLPLGTGDDGFLAALEQAARAVRACQPGALVVALGLDAAATDPFGALRISGDGFRRIGAAVARLGLPTVLVQEGGYLSPTLGDNLRQVLSGFEESV